MFKKKAFKLTTDYIVNDVRTRLYLNVPDGKTYIITMILVKIGIDKLVISMILMFL
jgi:hypothetical protein